MRADREDYFRVPLRFVIALFLLFPFLIWIGAIRDWSGTALADATGPLLQSVWQAGLSTVFTMVAGFFLFRALQGWRHERAFQMMESLLVVPNLVPPLFVALALLSWSAVVGAFPFGMGAVVVAHVLLNSGLVAVSLDRLFKAKVGGYAEAAWVMGIPPMTFVRQVAIPLLRGDLASLTLFIFALGLTSFSLPLLLGGDRIVTLEIAIYDSIRGEGRWDKAVLLAGFQTVFLFLLAVWLPKPLWSRRPGRWGLSYMKYRWGRMGVVTPVGLLAVGWSVGIFAGLGSGLEPQVLRSVGEGLLTSAAVGLAVGLFHVTLFLLTAYVLPHDRLEIFLNGYLAPSPAIVGFGLLLLPVESSFGRLSLLAVALTLISFPLLYRWLVHSSIRELSQQVNVARALGAGWGMVLFEIVWPQASGAILRASGLAALWASGDFALSGILLGDEVTLPLLITGLLGQYRFDAAHLLLFPLLMVGLVLYLLFVGVRRYVAR